MFIKSKSFCFVFLTLLLTTAGCSSGYEADTGLYQGNGITVSFPAGWAKAQTPPGSIFTIKQPEQLVQMSLFIKELEEITFEQYLQHLQRIDSALVRTGSRKKDDGTIEMGGKEGRWVKRELHMGGESFEYLFYSVMNGDKVYSIMGYAMSSSINEWEQVFDRVAKSIQFAN